MDGITQDVVCPYSAVKISKVGHDVVHHYALTDCKIDEEAEASLEGKTVCEVGTNGIGQLRCGILCPAN
jgi:hypothetical protein